MRQRATAFLLAACLLLAGGAQAGEPSGQLRETARKLLASGKVDDAVRAADLLAKASDIDAREAATVKTQAEIRKLAEPAPTESGWRLLIDITPFLSFLVVVATFAYNSYQSHKTDQERREEAARQRKSDDEKAAREHQAAEEARWANAVSLIQKSEEFSPAAALLSTFLSGPHREVARQTALSLMLAAKKFSNFTDLFNTFFEPVTHDNLPQVLALLRSVSITVAPLLTKAWVDDQNKLDALTAAERDAYDLLINERSFLGAKAAAVLRQPRRPGEVVDLGDIGFDGVDLSGADLRDCLAPRTWNIVNLDGADLRGLKNIRNTWVYNTAWWHASHVDPEFLDLLVARAPYKAGQHVNTPQPVSEDDYRRGVARLRMGADGEPWPAAGAAQPA
jgi:hypothetical protein